MHTSKEYRQTAWSAIKPVLPIMLLIFLVASLPQLIFMFIQTAFGLMPPMDTDLLLSDPDAFVAAYSAFMSSSKGITYSLLNTLFTLMTIPLTLGSIGAAQRILRGEDVVVRHSLAYIPYTFRAIWLQICTTFYAFWPMLLAYVVAIPVLLTVPSPDIVLLTAILLLIAVIATLVLAIMRTYSMVASDYLLARNPNTSVSEIMRTSRTIMKGNRMNFFLLELSFIGWNLLIAVLDSVVLSMAGYTLANVCSMLLSLFLGVYMTTAEAAFINDLTDAAPSDNASVKMTE